jgi:hypothetical protein
MKIELFKKQFKKYRSVSHSDTNELRTHFDYDYYRNEKSTGLFRESGSHDDEETFVNQISNPLYGVHKEYVMVVVEKNEDKVSLKLFYGGTHRQVGKLWFKKSKNVEFITVNTKTGNVYRGFIHNFQKKRSAKKSIRCNFFLNGNISALSAIIKNHLNHFTNENVSTTLDAFNIFLNHIDGYSSLNDNDFDSRLLRFHFIKKNIKFPDNFLSYIPVYFGKEIRKEIKKNGNKLVDGFMKSYGVKGKTLKKCLHLCEGLNIDLYKKTIELFDESWVNQDEKIVIRLLNNKNTLQCDVKRFKEYCSNEELKKVFEIYKEVFIQGRIDVNTLSDHINMYISLKDYGESDIKWKATPKTFRMEHLDWSDKLDHYRKGVYLRIYPEYFNEVLKDKFEDYTFNLLCRTEEYNEESFTQSNCVKTYIGRAASIIVSIRKGDDENQQRATVEYRIKKQLDKIIISRVQSLGRFNGFLGEEWNGPMNFLDSQMDRIVSDERFETTKIRKNCKNGVVLESDSKWHDDGYLVWTEKKSTEYEPFIENLPMFLI